MEKADTSTKIRGIMELIEGSIDNFKIYWKDYLLFQIVAGLITSIPVAVIAAGFVSSNWSKLSEIVNLPAHSSPEKYWDLIKGFVTDPWIIAFVVIALLLGSLMNLAFSKYVWQRLNKDAINIPDTLRYGLTSLPSYLLVSLATVFAVILGSVLFIIPGFVVAIWFSMFTLVFVAEGKRGIEVLKRSKELVKGYFWPLVGRFIVLGIATGIIGDITQRLASTGGTAGSIFSVLDMVVSMILTIIGVLYVYLMYRDLVEIKS